MTTYCIDGVYHNPGDASCTVGVTVACIVRSQFSKLLILTFVVRSAIEKCRSRMIIAYDITNFRRRFEFEVMAQTCVKGAREGYPSM